MTHHLQIRSPFRIKNRQGKLITLPTTYKLTGEARCYTTEKRVETMDFRCEPDENLIEEVTLIQGLPCQYVQFTDD